MTTPIHHLLRALRSKLLDLLRAFAYNLLGWTNWVLYYLVVCALATLAATLTITALWRNRQSIIRGIGYYAPLCLHLAFAAVPDIAEPIGEAIYAWSTSHRPVEDDSMVRLEGWRRQDTQDWDPDGSDSGQDKKPVIHDGSGGELKRRSPWSTAEDCW